MDAKTIRLPGDLVYSLWVPPLSVNVKTMTEIDNENKNLNDSTRLCLASTVPAYINFPIDSSAEELIADVKYGWNENATQLVPLTCLETFTTRSVNLNSYKTILADRYLNVDSWVQCGKMRGRIKHIESKYDLEIRHSRFVVQNVSEVEIDPLPTYYPGQYVYLRGWIGCVTHVRRKFLVRYFKGHECYICEKDYDEDNEEDEEAYPRPEFHLLHTGDTICPSSRDIQHAEWTKRPGWFDWLLLRYFSWTNSESTYAKVIDIALDSILVEWFNMPDMSAVKCPAPFYKIGGDELNSLLKLDIEGLWYGMKGKYRVKTSDVLYTLQEWEARLAAELGYQFSSRQAFLSTEKVEVVIMDSNSGDKSKFPPGTLITGRVIARRSIATVSWEDGQTSAVSVKELVPLYNTVDKNFPFPVGEVVLKLIYGASFKLLYGIVQSCLPGLCVVTWFGTETTTPEGESDSIFVKVWTNTEAVESLNLCNEYKFPYGMIVFTRAENTPGVVIGNSLSGQISVKILDKVQTFFAYELKKFDAVAYSIEHGCDVIFRPLENKYYLNHRQIGFHMGNIFNIVPPISALQSVPDSKCFEVLQNAPTTHRFYKSKVDYGTDVYQEVWRTEVALLETCRSHGIWIKVFEDRYDLFSVLMTGSPGSQYEGALFQFDLMLPPIYPAEAPKISIIPNSRADREMFSQNQHNFIDENGILRLENIWKEGEARGLWLLLIALQKELFGPQQMTEETEGTLNLIKKVAFTSFTKEIEDGIQNQVILDNIITSMVHLLISPPILWQNEVRKYWKLELPRFIARVKRIIRLCKEIDDATVQSEAGKYYSLIRSMHPPDAFLLSEINAGLRDLASAYFWMLDSNPVSSS